MITYPLRPNKFLNILDFPFRCSFFFVLHCFLVQGCHDLPMSHGISFLSFHASITHIDFPKTHLPTSIMLVLTCWLSYSRNLRGPLTDHFTIIVLFHWFYFSFSVFLSHVVSCFVGVQVRNIQQS